MNRRPQYIESYIYDINKSRKVGILSLEGGVLLHMLPMFDELKKQVTEASLTKKLKTSRVGLNFE